MKKTALYETHKKFGGRIVDFAGWQIPVQFDGIKEEHIAVRNSAGIFDISHMGEIEIKGNDAKKFLQWATTNDIYKLKDNTAQYSLLCYESGGVVDDVIIYKFTDENFMFCVNASNNNKVNKWLNDISSGFDMRIIDKSKYFSQFAVQGPFSINILNSALNFNFDSIRRFSFNYVIYNNINIIAARTGYTGEDGFELFFPWDDAEELWYRIYEIGKKHGMKFCGLGSRDTLRLEMGYSLYGHEIDESINPFEAGLNRFVSMDKIDFIGKEALQNYLNNHEKRKLIGFEMIDRGIPRKGYRIFNGEIEIGTVTSGTLSPSLQKPIGIGLIKYNQNEAKIGDKLTIEVRKKKRKILLCKIPFYKK